MLVDLLTVGFKAKKKVGIREWKITKIKTGNKKLLLLVSGDI